MITIQDLHKSYIIGWEPVDILQWINVHIDTWEFIAIMWPSWSWKSTLMNMIGLLDTASSWRYTFEGTDVSEFSEDEQAHFRRDKIWFIFQWYNLLPRIQAREQVALPLAYKWQAYKKRYTTAVDVLWKVWLADKVHHTPDMLSWWQQQRVCIARALACDPKLLLADEPTGALDSITSNDLLRLFTKLNTEGKTIIMITHDTHVASFAQRIIHIKDGKISD